MTILCPKGHPSTDTDYCSECGARIGARSAFAGAPSAPASAPHAVADAAPAADGGFATGCCADCGTARVGGARFCEVCRYDFQSAPASRPGPAPQSDAAATPAPVGQALAAPPAVAAPLAGPLAGPPADAAPLAARAPKLSVVVICDPSLDKNPDPGNPCPVNAPERVFPLDLAENLVGRRSESKDSHPEIPVNDPGISRRHLKFLRRADGAFDAVDLGSANGSTFNGKTLEPGVQTPVAPGDEIVIGAWTRLAFRIRKL